MKIGLSYFARFANDPSHRDNLVDVCGYAALIERCDEVAK